MINVMLLGPSGCLLLYSLKKVFCSAAVCCCCPLATPCIDQLEWSQLPDDSSFPYRVGLQLLGIASDRLEGVKKGR